MIACGLIGAAVALLVAPSSSTYQADALVVARQLVANQKVLPNLAATVFSDGAVAGKLASDPAVRGDTAGLIPDRVSVVAGQDSIVIDVQGRDADPATAARLANSAAVAFVAELNRPGAGVGQFAVQAQAVVPTTPLQEFSQQMRVALGALAGLILGFGLIALISVVRGPVVTAEDVEAAIGVPLLGTVELRRASRGAYLGPRGVRGIAAVTRSLAGVPDGRLALISPRSAAGIRRRMYVMVAIGLSHLRPVSFEAPDELVDAIRQNSPPHLEGSAQRTGRHGSGELVLADAGSAMDIIDPSMTSASIALVAPRGLPRRRLRALATDYVDGGLLGVILVRGRPGFSRAVRPARPAAPPETADPVPVQVSDVPAPERERA